MKVRFGYVRTTSMSLLLMGSSAISQPAVPPAGQAAPCTTVTPAVQAKPNVRFHMPQGLRKALDKEMQQIGKQTGVDLSGTLPSDANLAGALNGTVAPKPCAAPAVTVKPAAPVAPTKPAAPAAALPDVPYVPQ